MDDGWRCLETVRAGTNAAASDASSIARKSWRIDSVTTCLAAGFHRIDIIYTNQKVAEFYVVKGYPMKSFWSVLSAENHLQTHELFRTLHEAREFCMQIMTTASSR